MRLLLVIFGGLLLILSSVLTMCSSKEPISYNQDIRPVINNQCIACHGGVKKSAGLSFLTREEAMDSTESGLPAIVPGDAKHSELIKRLKHHDLEQRMPLEAKPLPEETIRKFEQWINEGAKWEKHWAFIPPQKDIEVPAVSKDWGKNGIDQFILQKLEIYDLAPEAKAEKAVLLRRLYLDLIGIPPSQQEAEAFLQDERPDAYEKLVDKLLASPHFGERWASMWLDLARYADSKGYEKDLNRNIWQYRDWVIKAFNNDMPFDQFTVEQLAGDLLPQPTEDQLIATAFHRNTMTNDEGGTVNEEFRTAAVIDRVSTTFEVWQGVTMGCVQCHSHPYDPVFHEEFYQFMDYFNNTIDADVYNERPLLFNYEEEDAEKVSELVSWLDERLPAERKVDQNALLHERKEQLLYNADYRRVEAESMHNNHQIIELIPDGQDVVWQIQDSTWIMFEDVDLTDVEAISFRCATPLSGKIEVKLDSLKGATLGEVTVNTTGSWDNPMMVKPEPALWKNLQTSITKTEGLHDVYYLFKKHRHTGQHLFHLDWIEYHEKTPLKETYDQEFNEKLEELASVKPMSTPIMGEKSPDRSRITHVFERGNWLVLGKEVSSAVPEIMGELPQGVPNNRLGMAQWLVNKDNPLTARVTVNRFWEQLFGYGLVETMEDFGSQGFAPSHPELLDWLAVQFMEEYDWSIKKLLKTMVMSATYQQASQASPEKIAKDPKNTYLARGPKVRLSSEQIRDQALAASGLLNPDIGGPSIMPPRPDMSNSNWTDWKTTEGKAQHRRGLYVFWRRTDPYPSMITFDSPVRNVCTSRRIRTNTPLQALTLLNDSVYYVAAEALAERMMENKQNDVDAQLEAGYRMLIFKAPSQEKLLLLKKLYDEALLHYQQVRMLSSTEVVSTKDTLPAETYAMRLVANALLNLDEVINKN